MRRGLWIGAGVLVLALVLGWIFRLQLLLFWLDPVGSNEPMEVTNTLLPSTEEQLLAFAEPGPDGPVIMVNLLKFKDRAEYEDGRETTLSGREAYALYGEAVTGILEEFGGRILFTGDVTFLALGEVEELWDEVALAEYPNRAALVKMSNSPQWREASVHRTAGLKGQLNIETTYGAWSPRK